MSLPKLDPRLMMLAELVRRGSRTADIGTDHGYLITWLAATGKIPGGYACDINRKPLEKAAFSLHSAGVQDRVHLCLCDGLSGLTPGSCDDIIIAGMGGDTIWSIIDAAPWTRDGELRLILQPMTKAPELRRRLCQNGFAMEQEKAAVSAGFPYSAMAVRYTGEKREIPPALAWGGLLAEDPSPSARAYIERVRRLLGQKAEGLKRAKNPGPELLEYEETLAALQNMKTAETPRSTNMEELDDCTKRI